MDEGDYRRASSGSVVLKVGISIVPMRPIAPALSLQQHGNGEKSESVTRPGLTTDLAMVRAQHPPYPSAHATTGHPATGRAAPSPPGLLTAVPLIHPQGASAGKTVIADASPVG
jgi:hypothetical protein